MKRRTQIVLTAVLVVGLAVVGFLLYSKFVANPRVVAELQSDPNGARAQRVMLRPVYRNPTAPACPMR